MKTVAQINAAIADIDRAVADLELQAQRHALASLGGGLEVSSIVIAQRDADYRQALEIIADKTRQRQRLAYALVEAERLEVEGDI